MSDKMSDEKVALLRSYGAEVVVCPTAVPPEDPRSYYSTAERLVRETPGAFRPDQYSNAANPLAHEHTTGPEIWQQTRGRVTHFVAGVGTGGTITGVGRALKARNPGVQIIGADPSGSVYSGGTGRPYLTEGVGEDFWPTTFDRSVVDRVMEVSDADSFLMARRVTHEEGLLIGGSGGTAVHAALEVARPLGADAVVVVLLPDSGRSYLSKIFDDQWMFDMGFLRGEGLVAGDVLAREGPGASRPRARAPRGAGARRDLRDARDRRLAARRECHEGTAARGQGGRRDAARARADGPHVPRRRRARPPDRRGHDPADADDRDR